MMQVNMTREEAITQLELLLEYCESMMTSEYPVWRRDCEALQMLIAALRPVSREQVEKVCWGEWVHDPETGYEHCDKCSHTISLDDYMNRKPPLFCEMCGDAKTDEAVQMVMERLEELHDTSN